MNILEFIFGIIAIIAVVIIMICYFGFRYGAVTESREDKMKKEYEELSKVSTKSGTRKRKNIGGSK